MRTRVRCMKIIARKETFIRARVLQGMTQRELANKCGLSYAYISLLERSVKPVGPGTAKKLSEVLNRPMEELFIIE